MKVILRQCCVCKRFLTTEGRYVKLLPTCPHLAITSGYCPDDLAEWRKDMDLRISRRAGDQSHRSRLA